MAKEQFQRNKPHVNVGTIVHVDHGLIPIVCYDYQKEIIEKMKTTKRANGTLNVWKGTRGGNGQLTPQQEKVAIALGWETELSIPTADHLVMGKRTAWCRKKNIPTNYKPTILNTGCCGMAGSFGYEKDKYEVSMQIGEQTLFPAIRKASGEVVISANGTSCRHQIKDGTNRNVKHPMSILKDALV